MEGTQISGDCNIQLLLKKAIGGEIELCHFWFNTGFHCNEMHLKLDKPSIDIANKDKKNKVFKEDFALEAFFQASTGSVTTSSKTRTLSTTTTTATSSTTTTTTTTNSSVLTMTIGTAPKHFTSSSSTGKSVTFMAARPSGCDRRQQIIKGNTRGEGDVNSENEGSTSLSQDGEEKQEKDESGGSGDGGAGRCGCEGEGEGEGGGEGGGGGGGEAGTPVTRERNLSFYGYAMHSILIDAGVTVSSSDDEEDDGDEARK
eukprot:TRINITY_DN4576_c0_g1_i4.p1 TRINITY_DN4576_c0_g1~~TRINITY_DN4576_c0_g1_i4.p1  ORF type:complete len:258 (-),score=87.09 TRINITY_DN4576_c0_g1_i4:211-984(-)